MADYSRRRRVPSATGSRSMPAAFGVVEKPLSGWERLGNIGAARKLALLVVLALVWEVYARWLNNPLLFPTSRRRCRRSSMPSRAASCRARRWTSMKVLLTGYAAGIYCARRR